MLWIRVGSVECGKLVDWAACVCATIDCLGPTATWSAMSVLYHKMQPYLHINVL